MSEEPIINTDNKLEEAKKDAGPILNSAATKPDAGESVLEEFQKKASEAEEKEEVEAPKKVVVAEGEKKPETKIYTIRTTANREDQVLEFVSSNAARKKLPVFSVISPHGMRGYIFIEATDRISAEQAAYGVPYAKGLLPKAVEYKEIEHMLEQVKRDINIQKNDIAEIISGAFKRDKAKITRVDKVKGEVVVELLESPVPIPITLPIDSVKVIRREDG
ncbi:transcription elongation factor Spt5, partial [Candidatus Woesearchaeota archaeon]|nr:transcription elongation factor Spt5 [Candidatus Woesearchaeota archaeon]